jgi:hypothetical protein
MPLYDEIKNQLATRLGIEPDKLPPTLTVAKAGKAAYGLSPARSYAAVKDGSIEVMTVAGRQHVVTLKLIRKLAAEAA